MIGSLFSGYGGLCELAVAPLLGDRVAWHCEFDKDASSILKHHWPDTPNLGDITKVDWTAVEPVDVLTAGYPCQPFSHAGQRLGTEDKRHLWPYVAEAVGALRPRLCIFENVRGHLTLGFDHVLRDLTILGYRARWIIVRASDAGAPHGRARLFIVAEDERGRVCGRSDRRGGVHRDSGVRWLVPGATEGRDDGQGAASPSAHGAAARREDRSTESSHGDEPGITRLATDRSESESADSGASAPSPGESDSSGCGAGVSVDGGCLPEAAERTGDVDSRDAGAGGDVRASDQGSEPHGAGSQSSGSPAGGTPGGVPVGLVVGTAGRSVRPGGVQGEAADGGGDAVGPRLLPTPTISDTNGSGAHGDGGLDLRTAVSLLPTPRATRGGSATETTALLPTPTAQAAKHSGDDRGPGTLDDHNLWSVAARLGALLPTPAVNDMGDGKTPDAWDAWTANMQERHGNGNGHGKSLAIEAQRLLPTPKATNNENRQNEERYGPNLGMVLGTTPGYESQWGIYADAIARWEHRTRPAPAPTMTSTKGTPQLAPAFSEWLMGLPAGHVTDVPGLSRSAQLKALGNGVVPQQAALALRYLLGISEAVAA